MTRTHDLLITNQLLYRLSYTSEFLTACTFYHKSLRMSTPKFDDYYLFSCMKKCCFFARFVGYLRFMSLVQNLHCYPPPQTHVVSGICGCGANQSSYIFVTRSLHNILSSSPLLRVINIFNRVFNTQIFQCFQCVAALLHKTAKSGNGLCGFYKPQFCYHNTNLSREREI